VPPQPCVYPDNLITFVPPSPFPSTSCGVLLYKQVQLIAATDTHYPPCITFRGVAVTYLTYERLCLLGDELPGPHEGPRKGQQLRGHRARHTRSDFHTTHLRPCHVLWSVWDTRSVLGPVYFVVASLLSTYLRGPAAVVPVHVVK
jgi:hypothetical protein